MRGHVFYPSQFFHIVSSESFQDDDEHVGPPGVQECVRAIFSLCGIERGIGLCQCFRIQIVVFFREVFRFEIGIEQAEGGIDGCVVQVVVFAEIGTAHVHRGTSHSSPDGKENQSAQQDVHAVACRLLPSANQFGEMPGSQPYEKPGKQGGKGANQEQAYDDVECGYAGQGLLGGIQVIEDGGIQFELPEGVEGSVAHANQGNQERDKDEVGGKYRFVVKVRQPHARPYHKERNG